MTIEQRIDWLARLRSDVRSRILNEPCCNRYIEALNIEISELTERRYQAPTVVENCSTCKYFRTKENACIADYMTQHRCTNHSEWESKENDS